MRLIDVDALQNILLPITTALEHEYGSLGGAVSGCMKHIDNAPTVDAVPVVRCKDCKYADTERRNATEKRYYNSILFCRNSNLCNDEPLAMWPDDFCSYGVAKGCANDEP